MQTILKPSVDRAHGRAAATTSLRRASIVFGAGIGLSSGFATLYFGTLSVFLKPISADLGWTRAQTSVVTVVSMLGLAIGAPMVGRLIDRFGAGRIIAASIFLFALMMLTVSLVPIGLGSFALLSVLAGAVAAATTPPGYLSVLPHHFDSGLGLALGSAMVGLGLGTVIAPIAVQSWIASDGWQSAYRHLAATAAGLGALAWVLMFMGTAAGRVPRAQQTLSRSREQDATSGDTFKAAMQGRRFWIVAFVMFVVSAAGLGATVHIVSLFTDRGMTSETAARAAAVAGAGVVLGRLIAGALMDRIHAPYVASVAFLLGSMGLFTILLNPDGSFTLLSSGTFLFGFAIGAEGDFIPFFVRRYFGLRSFGTIFGFFFCIYSLGGVVGPALFGITFDRLHSYSPALGAAAFACLVCSAVVLTLGRYRFIATPPGKPL